MLLSQGSASASLLDITMNDEFNSTKWIPAEIKSVFTYENAWKCWRDISVVVSMPCTNYNSEIPLLAGFCSARMSKLKLGCPYFWIVLVSYFVWTKGDTFSCSFGIHLVLAEFSNRQGGYIIDVIWPFSKQKNILLLPQGVGDRQYI